MELMRRKRSEIRFVLSAPAAWVGPLVGVDANFLHDASCFDAEPLRSCPARSAAYGYENTIFESTQTTTRLIHRLSMALSQRNRINFYIHCITRPIKSHDPRGPRVTEAFMAGLSTLKEPSEYTDSTVGTPFAFLNVAAKYSTAAKPSETE